MAGVKIAFTLNDLMRHETTVIVDNPFKVAKTGLKAYGQKSEPSEGIFQIPNSDVVSFIEALINAMPYAIYDRSELQRFSTLTKVAREFTFHVSSASPRLYSLFVKLYKAYVKDKGQ